MRAILSFQQQNGLSFDKQLVGWMKKKTTRKFISSQNTIVMRIVYFLSERMQCDVFNSLNSSALFCSFFQNQVFVCCLEHCFLFCHFGCFSSLWIRCAVAWLLRKSSCDNELQTIRVSMIFGSIFNVTLLTFYFSATVLCQLFEFYYSIQLN